MSRGAGEASEAASGGTPAAKPRTWLPMALWSAGIALVILLTWFIAAVVVPWWQVRSVLLETAASNGFTEQVAEKLGGPEAAFRKIALYIRLPRGTTPERPLAVCALGRVGKRAVPFLISQLSDPEWEVRLGAVDALHMIGPDAHEAIPALLETINDPQPQVSIHACRALGGMGPHGRGFVPRLCELLRDGNAWRRFEAAEALGLLGPNAREAMDALEAARGDSDALVRDTASEAIRKIRGEEPPR